MPKERLLEMIADLKRTLLASTAWPALLTLDERRQKNLQQVFIPNIWSFGTVRSYEHEHV